MPRSAPYSKGSMLQTTLETVWLKRAGGGSALGVMPRNTKIGPFLPLGSTVRPVWFKRVSKAHCSSNLAWWADRSLAESIRPSFWSSLPLLSHDVSLFFFSGFTSKRSNASHGYIPHACNDRPRNPVHPLSRHLSHCLRYMTTPEKLWVKNSLP